MTLIAESDVGLNLATPESSICIDPVTARYRSSIGKTSKTGAMETAICQVAVRDLIYSFIYYDPAVSISDALDVSNFIAKMMAQSSRSIPNT